MNIFIKKNLNTVRKIVKEVFKKASKEHATSAKSTLSKYIVEKIDKKFNISISERTLIRSYNRYILSRRDLGTLTAENVDILCKYLGYKDYSAYLKKNIKRLILKIFSCLTIVIIFTFGIYKNSNRKKIKIVQCMVWKETKYIAISCNKYIDEKDQLKIIPRDEILLEKMKKVNLKRSDIIFTEDGKPLYWYSKKNSEGIEFFTTHGFHPITDKNLKPITKTIFDKYVPIHVDDGGSYVNPSTK